MIPAEVRIRPMTSSDLTRVLAIAENLDSAPQWPVTAYQEALDPHAVVRRIAIVAEDTASAQIVGFAVASLVADQAELEIIAVAAKEQRRGIARKLFFALAEALRGAKATELILEVRASNHPALALYRALGFEQIGLRTSYYHDPVEDAVLMRLPL